MQLEDINDVLKREKIFKKYVQKYLDEIIYKSPDSNFKSELLRTQKELDDLEKEVVKEKPILTKKVVKDEGESSDEYEPELSGKERRINNKKRYPDHVTKGKRRKETKRRIKSNRRRRR